MEFLRKRHKKALEENKEEVEARVIALNDDSYIVKSSQSDHYYDVSRCESKECDRENSAMVCGLLCDSCNILNICFHSFSCTCVDSSIKSNMCKHIHLVGLYLKKKRPEPESYANRCDDREDVAVPVSYVANSHDENSSSITMEGQTQKKKRKLIQSIKTKFKEVNNNLKRLSNSQLRRIDAEMKTVLLESRLKSLPRKI